MEKIKVCLVGGQPVPNMLLIKHYQPDQVILVCSEETKSVSERLEKVLENKTNVSILQVDPYNLIDIKKGLKEQLSTVNQQMEIIVNVTGGTKIMSYAAIQAVQELESKVVYLQSEKNQSKLYQYQLKNGELSLSRTEIIQEVLNIDEYLRIHVGSYRRQINKNIFEQNVLEALKPHVYEIVPNVRIDPNIELDLVLRIGNQVGVVEATIGKPNKSKIDQLNSATRRESLGIYTKRFLITTQKLEQNNRNLAEIIKITVIELLNSSNDKISNEDRVKLIREVKNKF